MAEKLSYEELEQRIREFGDEITHYKKAEEALKESKAKLEGRLEASRAELSAINTSLQNEISGRQRAENALLKYMRVEEQMARHENLLRAVLHSIEDGVIATNAEGRVSLINENAERLTGWTRAEAFNKPLHEIFHVVAARTPEFLEDPLQNTDADRKHLTQRTEAVLSSRDETERIIATTGVPIVTRQGETIGDLLVFRDISQERTIGTQLINAQKREAIGTLASGIAHDINNVLAAVVGFTELAMLDTEKETQLRANLEEVLTAGFRGRDLAKRILAFASERQQDKKLLRIGPTIREALGLIRGILPATVEIRQTIDAEPDVVLADPNQIHQVLTNLCTNAAQAMKNRGRLTVCLTRVDTGSEARVRHPELRPGPYLKLTVSDTGHGMGREVMERIFDPFFTTKDPAEGSGMGLAVVRGIVTSHEGSVTVSSEPGKGTTFQILLPVAEGEAEPAQKSAESAPARRRHVLFVDDEPSIVKFAKMLLERELEGDYEITGCTSSVDALETFRARPQEFDLVVTDMTMPNMTGEDLAIELLRIRKDIPIILCTGDSEAIDPERARMAGIREIHKKPVLAKDLSTTIMKVLNEER